MPKEEESRTTDEGVKNEKMEERKTIRREGKMVTKLEVRREARRGDYEGKTRRRKEKMTL